MGKVEISAGQVRKGSFANTWAVLHAHPTRRGFWVICSSHFPYDIIVVGRRELEQMPVIEDVSTYYAASGGVHQGYHYWRSFQNAAFAHGLSDANSVTPPYKDERSPWKQKYERLKALTR